MMASNNVPLLFFFSADQVEPIALGVIQEVMEFSPSFLEKSNFTQNDPNMEVCLFILFIFPALSYFITRD